MQSAVPLIHSHHLLNESGQKMSIVRNGQVCGMSEIVPHETELGS